ncbi:MAG: hypothetical protein NVSMB18_18600 [Acetobacteraceae bacterium]
MSSLAQLPAASLAVPPDHAAASAALQSGQVFVCLLSNNPAALAAAVRTATEGIADMDTRFARVANPLRAPLTLERLFMQVAGPNVDPRHERDPAALTQLLASPIGDESRLIIAIEQAETLDDEAVECLVQMEPCLSMGQPRVQILFAAPPGFAARLGRTETAASSVSNSSSVPASPPPPPGGQLPVRAPTAPPPEPPEPPAGELVPMPAPRPKPAPSSRGGQWLVLGMLLLLGLLGLGLAFTWLAYPGEFHRQISPIRAAPPSPAAAPQGMPPSERAAPPRAPTLGETESETAIRRDFDQFLVMRGGAAARLTDSQRETLFQEFLARRRAAPR